MSPDAISEILRLPTIDDTQTAFAASNIFISETTAARWRSTGDIGEIMDSLAEPPVKVGCLAHLIKDPKSTPGLARWWRTYLRSPNPRVPSEVSVP